MGDRDEPGAAQMLDAYFEAARAETAAPSTELMARVLSDAQDVQDGLLAPSDKAMARFAGLRRAVRALGGWPAVAGLASATVAGVWIGATQPNALTPYTSLLQQDAALYQIDLPAGAGFDLDEGTL